MINIFTKEKKEIHPFELYFIPEKASTLFIGSFPTEKSKRGFEFFYPNANNRFWKIVHNVYEKNKPALLSPTKENKNNNPNHDFVKERKELALKHHFGLTDIIRSCYRLYNNAKDEQLYVIEYNNVFKLLKENQHIDKVILTGKGNSSVHHHFYQYLIMNNIEFSYSNIENTFIGEIAIDRRIVKIYTLPTTSSRYSNEAHVTQEYLKILSK